MSVSTLATWGTDQDLTWGELFGDDERTWHDYGAIRRRQIGGKDRPAPVVHWLRALQPLQMPRYGSVAHCEVILPMTSRRPAQRPATPLPCPTTCWNDEQDLADILRLLKLVP